MIEETIRVFSGQWRKLKMVKLNLEEIEVKEGLLFAN